MNWEALMVWAEVRKAYPDQWLIIEAIDAHTEDDRRLLDRVAVVETCPDGTAVMQAYERLHHEYPARDFYFVHAGREDLDIREWRWIGIRRNDAAYAQRGAGAGHPSRGGAQCGVGARSGRDWPCGVGSG